MRKIILAIFVILTLLIPIASKADGGIMPRPGYWISETDQKAVIVFENNTETLILSTTFQGNAKDFSWIIPTPAQPQVDKGAYGIFEALQDLTNVYESRSFDYSTPLGVGAMPEKATVNVIEQKKIDVYDITVLEANDKEALYTWLKDNGYNYPEYGKTVLDDYIRNSWFFTAVKINAEDLALAENRLNTGTITPLKLTFASDKIVYPLKISSITMNDPNVNTMPSAPIGIMEDTVVSPNKNTDITPNNYVGIQLYIFADHKKQISGFSEDYANWVDTKEIKKLAFDDNGNAWYSPSGNKMYLTSLSRNMNTRDMRTDVFPINADNNQTNPPSQFWTNLFATIMIVLLIIISPIGLIYVILMLLFIFLKSKTAKVLSLISQGLIALFGVICSIIIAVYLIEDYAGTVNDILPALIASLIMTVAVIVGIILEIVIGKRKKIL